MSLSYRVTFLCTVFVQIHYTSESHVRFLFYEKVVSLMLCVPVWNRDKISYLAVPLGYRMWQKKESKLELAASMVRHVMPEFSSQKNVIILCDSWYTKQNLVSIVKEYPNLDLIENARADSIIYDHL